jgi:hypothetical protein
MLQFSPGNTSDVVASAAEIAARIAAPASTRRPRPFANHDKNAKTTTAAQNVPTDHSKMSASALPKSAPDTSQPARSLVDVALTE